MLDKTKIAVYIDTGCVYEYEVSSPMKGREHAAAIIKSGYRSSGADNKLEWFPPHRIVKVVVEGGGESTNYQDKVRAT